MHDGALIPHSRLASSATQQVASGRSVAVFESTFESDWVCQWQHAVLVNYVHGSPYYELVVNVPLFNHCLQGSELEITG